MCFIALHSLGRASPCCHTDDRLTGAGRPVEFNSSSTHGLDCRAFELSARGPVFFPARGHFYVCVVGALGWYSCLLPGQRYKGANSFEEKENALTTPASPKQRIQQLDIKRSRTSLICAIRNENTCKRTEKT